jgi:predicted RNA-binding protein with PUA-like domain
MKSEPDVFSIDDLKKKHQAPWDGVRNFQARNHMREMKVGDLVLFYHSSTQPPGVAGVARICREAHPDPTAWDKKSEYFDPRSTREKPVWDLVDVEFVEKLPRLVSLDEIKADPALGGMEVTRKPRLSVQPVAPEDFQRILARARNG